VQVSKLVSQLLQLVGSAYPTQADGVGVQIREQHACYDFCDRETDRVFQFILQASTRQLQFNPSTNVTLALFFVYLDLASATDTKLFAMYCTCSHVKPSNPSF
jgi:hypothetical protein